MMHEKLKKIYVMNNFKVSSRIGSYIPYLSDPQKIKRNIFYKLNFLQLYNTTFVVRILNNLQSYETAIYQFLTKKIPTLLHFLIFYRCVSIHSLLAIALKFSSNI